MFPRALQPRSERLPLRDTLRRAADLIVAFATLEEVSGSRDHPGGHGSIHPHRRPLRPGAHARRPGAVAARPAVCTSPVGAITDAPVRRGPIDPASDGSAWAARIASSVASRRGPQRRRAAHGGGS